MILVFFFLLFCSVHAGLHFLGRLLDGSWSGGCYDDYDYQVDETEKLIFPKKENKNNGGWVK